METAASVLTRLESLEAQVRRWKKISLSLLLGITVLIVGAAAAPQERFTPYHGDGFVQQIPANRLLAHSFVLLGKDGKQYARLALDQQQPVLEFYDGRGNVIWSAPPQRGFVPAESKSANPR